MDNSDGKKLMLIYLTLRDDYGHTSAGYWHRKYREHREISHREVQWGAENEVVKNTRMNLVHGWCLKMAYKQFEQPERCMLQRLPSYSYKMWCQDLSPAGNRAPLGCSLSRPPWWDGEEKIWRKAHGLRQGRGGITHQLQSRAKPRLSLGKKNPKSV